MRRISLFLFMVTLVVSAQTQGTPDFSGSWKMNVSKSRLPKHSQIQSETLVVKEDGQSIEFHSDIDGRQSIEVWTIDKKEKVIREVQGGGNIVGKAYWKGTTLVTESRAVLKMPNSPFNDSELLHVKNSWTMSSDGAVLTEKLESDDSKSMIVYDKQ